MIARIHTVAFQGTDVYDVDVEVQIANGLPSFAIVGLPDKAVAESKERVRAALHSLGLSLPPKRLTVNLAPADIAKEGSHYDLPIALGVLAALDVLPREELLEYVVLGELGLDASIRSVAGVLPSAMHAVSKDRNLICPQACGAEAAWAGELEILAPRDLLQLMNHMKGAQVLSQPRVKTDYVATFKGPDLADVKGQETAKRALEIAAAGGHNLLMAGPPGSGKSMLASCLPGILPPLDAAEALETSMIHSLAGDLPEEGLIRTRPYRDPHHSASLPALVGGGHKANPGEISLAHNGVLFLDELPEFARSTLESLRQPLETGKTLISRANHHVTYPAAFQLIAAMNPCRCGYLGDSDRECTKAPRCAADYQSKLSGPFLDRIDIRIDVQPVPLMELTKLEKGEASAVVAKRIEAVRHMQKERSGSLNANLSGDDLESVTRIDGDLQSFVSHAAEKLKLSARSYHRLLRVARTIADLDYIAGQKSSDSLQKHHIAEALSYRHAL